MDEKDMVKLNHISENIAVIRQKIISIECEIRELKSEFKNYVRVERFAPIEKIAYTTIGIVLTAIVGAILTLVLIK